MSESANCRSPLIRCPSRHDGATARKHTTGPRHLRAHSSPNISSHNASKKNRAHAVLFTAALGIMALLMGQPANAQTSGPDPTPTCLPDCFNSHWGARASIVLTLSNGCQVRAYYRTRLACNYWQDILIDETHVLGPSGCWLQARNWNPANVVNEVSLLLMQANPMNFLPNTPGQPCQSNWRVTVGGCWRVSGTPWDPSVPYTPENTWFFPCEPEACCLRRYEVCIDSNGNRTFSQIPFEYEPPVCPPTVNGEPCVPVCE